MGDISVNLGTMIVAAIVFYFVIKYAVRQAIIEADVKNESLKYQVKVDELLNELTLYRLESRVSDSDKKVVLQKLKDINNRSYEIYIADMDAQKRYQQMQRLKQEADILVAEVAPK